MPLQIEPSIVSCSGTESIAHESRGPNVKPCRFPAETLYSPPEYIVPLKFFRNRPEPLLQKVNLDHYTQKGHSGKLDTYYQTGYHAVHNYKGFMMPGSFHKMFSTILLSQTVPYAQHFWPLLEME